jgi:hypothetical protein
METARLHKLSVVIPREDLLGRLVRVGPATAARILAVEILYRPLRVIAGPLRDVHLRCEHALLQRSLEGELDMLLLAYFGLCKLANQHDDLNHCAPPRGQPSIM